MTFEEWFTGKCVMSTVYSDSTHLSQSYNIKEFIKAAWEAGYAQGYELGPQAAFEQVIARIESLLGYSLKS